MDTPEEVRPARFLEGQVPDYNPLTIGEAVASLVGRIHGQGLPVLDAGTRAGKRFVGKRQRLGASASRSHKRLSPTRSERMNRALKELGSSAFKIHCLLWQWRGAPAKGHLPFFTIHSLGKFCDLTRPTVRSGLTELVRKGWIQKLGYNKHIKNELYRLIPIRDVPGG